VADRPPRSIAGFGWASKTLSNPDEAQDHVHRPLTIVPSLSSTSA